MDPVAGIHKVFCASGLCTSLGMEIGKVIGYNESWF